jgi:hypothetical protein
MRTNARMNRFEHCSEPKQRATISAHLHTFTRMYAPIFCLVPFRYNRLSISQDSTCGHHVRTYAHPNKLLFALRAPCLTLFIRAVTCTHNPTNRVKG